MYCELNLYSKYVKGDFVNHYFLKIQSGLKSIEQSPFFIGHNINILHKDIIEQLEATHPEIQNKLKFLNIGNALKRIGYERIHLVTKGSSVLSTPQMRIIRNNLQKRIQGLDIITQEIIDEIEKSKKEEYYKKPIYELNPQKVFPVKFKIVPATPQ